MQGAHGGMHEKWHVAYEEALHVPFVVSGPLMHGGAREVDMPTNHADLIPTLIGLAGIDADDALARSPATTPKPDRSSAATCRRWSGRAGAHRTGPVHDR